MYVDDEMLKVIVGSKANECFSARLDPAIIDDLIVIAKSDSDGRLVRVLTKLSLSVARVSAWMPNAQQVCMASGAAAAFCDLMDLINIIQTRDVPADELARIKAPEEISPFFAE